MAVHFLLSGSEYQVINYNVEDGLSQSSVQALNMDVFGYLWISTGDGLTCFDGRTFSRYYVRGTDGNASLSNSIRHLISDSTGNLWVGSDFGLLYFDRSKQLLVPAFQGISDLSGKPCLPLFLEEDSLSVLVPPAGIITINLSDKKIHRQTLRQDIKGLEINPIRKNEKWLIVSLLDVLKLEHTYEKGIVQTHYRITDLMGESHRAFLPLTPNRTLFATSGALHMLYASGKTERMDVSSLSFLPENTRIHALANDNSGNIWLLTSNYGIYILDHDFNLQNQIVGLSAQDGSQVPVEAITTGFTDKQGNIWFGTDGHGLALLPARKPLFTKVNRLPDGNGGSLVPFVRSFLETGRDTLWIGTYNAGIFGWNKKQGVIFHLNNGLQYGGFTFGDVYCMLDAGRLGMLTGTANGLWILKNGKLKPVDLSITQNSINKVANIVNESDSSYLLRINNRIFRLIFDENGNPEVINTSFPAGISYELLTRLNGEVLIFS
ncbi:MAG: hypothetical protein KDC05_02645, partial [Bacteroidales bacterium]|nr:hypothetical protein [Bacteroidales bacterium]